MTSSYKYFNKEWFNKHQSKLLWLLRFRLFRYLLRIDCNETINRIEPNAYWFGAVYDGKKVTVKADFRTHDKYSKRLYHAFKPLWYAFHYWDKVANLFIPQWNLGFDTLTAYPDPSPETTTVDGHVGYTGSGETYSQVRDAASGTNAVDSETTLDIMSRFNGSNYIIRRGFFLFDTSSLTASATISAATLSLSSNTGNNSNANSTSINIYATTPASNTALVSADYSQIGSTAQCDTSINISSLTSGYNDFVLNSTGLGNISKTGVSKFGGRIVERDVTSSAPTGTNYAAIYAAEQAGVTNDPKLVVTYLVQINPSVSDTATTGDTISIVTANLFNVANPQSQGVKIVNN